MFDTIVVTTDGSASVRRAVSVAVDLVERFDAPVHILYVVDTGNVKAASDRLRNEMCDALTERGEEALVEVKATTGHEVIVAVREGRPATEASNYAHEADVNAVTMGTQGRHGENRFFIGNTAERAVRACPVLMLTVCQLEEGATDSLLSDETA